MDHDFSLLRMDDESFQKLSTYVTREYGIKLPENKRSMLESRLNKKVKSLGLSSYRELIQLIFSPEGMKEELYHVIDIITTNKTDFFREPAHFHFLKDVFLPSYLSAKGYSNLNIWSAGCSTGEEPYSLIMLLEEYKKSNPALTYRLLASDISIRAMRRASQGIYELPRIENISLDLKRQYFLKSKLNPDLVRIKPAYRKSIQFRRINLMEDRYGLPRHDFDIIFCRNVLIYFDKKTQEDVIRKFCDHLKPGGLLFLGHSESIMGMRVKLKQVRPTVYQVL